MPIFVEFLPFFALLIAIGALAGVIAGLLGVGGGIVLVPAFYYCFVHFGYDGPHIMQVCVATSLATIIVTSVRSVLSHHKKGAVEWQILREWSAFIALGAVFGAFIASMMNAIFLKGIFGFIGVGIGLYMAFGNAEWRRAEHMPRGLERTVIGTGIGFLSALMGIGGGSFAVPLMTLHGVTIHRAVATSAGIGVVAALPATLLFLTMSVENPPPFSLGAVNLPSFAIVILMTLFTAPLGVRLSHRLNPKPLKRIFAGFITIVALNMLRKFAGF